MSTETTWTVERFDSTGRLMRAYGVFKDLQHAECLALRASEKHPECTVVVTPGTSSKCDARTRLAPFLDPHRNPRTPPTPRSK